MTDGRDDKGRYRKGNQAALKHGGGAAIDAIRKGKPLTGLAADAELAVAQELETDGRYALVVRNARRLQAAADLYWNAVSKAAQDEDLDALDKYIKRYGWLAGCALRAWTVVKADEPRTAWDYDAEVEKLRQQGEAD
jgi:hypothetical protein